MKQIRILKVVVASPGDVQAERNLIEEVVKDLNQGVAADRKLRLEVARWETDAYAGFHPEEPQGLIDSLLEIEACDVLISIFWNRFGTPTKDAQSGTEHELRKAISSLEETGRPHVMVSFNKKHYTPQSDAESEQMGQIRRFRDELSGKALLWSYTKSG